MAGGSRNRVDRATKTQSFPAEPGTCIGTGKTYTAVVQTDVGSFKITLDATAAPKTLVRILQ